jgi:hypothetical protein
MSFLKSLVGESLHHPMLSLSILAVCAIGLSGRWTKMWGQVVVLAVYLAAINFTAWEISIRASENVYTQDRHVNYVANRNLVKNTLLAKAYLKEPRDIPPGYFWYLPRDADFEGKYLSKDVQAGDDVDPLALVNKPSVPTNASVFPMPDSSDVSKLIDAGAQVQWCLEDGTCIPGAAKVEAIVCSDSARGHCYIVVTIDNAVGSKITSKHKLRMASLQ